MHIIKYYLGIKRNGDLIHIMTWMNFVNIILRERIQMQKDHKLYDSFK